MSRVTDRNDWYELWVADKESMFNTMVQNMISDLEAGYAYYGKSITEQRKMIDDYKAETDKTMDMFKDMEFEAVNRWCYYDMKKRGVIS